MSAGFSFFWPRASRFCDVLKNVFDLLCFDLFLSRGMRRVKRVSVMADAGVPDTGSQRREYKITPEDRSLKKFLLNLFEVQSSCAARASLFRKMWYDFRV